MKIYFYLDIKINLESNKKHLIKGFLFSWQEELVMGAEVMSAPLSIRADFQNVFNRTVNRKPVRDQRPANTRAQLIR